MKANVQLSTPLYSQERTPVHTEYEAGYNPKLMWMILEIKTLAPSVIRNTDHLTRGLVTTPTTLSRFL